MTLARFLQSWYSTFCIAGARTEQPEEEVVQKIEKLGGQVTRDKKAPAKPVIRIDFPGRNLLTDADLKDFKSLKHLTFLSLSGSKVTDTWLKQLKDLTQLRSLRLYDSMVTSPGVADLKKALPELTVEHFEVSKEPYTRPREHGVPSPQKDR